MKNIITDYGQILIGNNDKENWEIIDNSEPDDLWFHLLDYPSCHIVAQLKKNISELEINYIAQLVREYSPRFKNKNNLKVSYCSIKDVKKNKKKTGSVFIKDYSIIMLT